MPSIQDLMDPAFEQKTIWVKYLDTFEIELRFLSRAEMTRILDKSKRWEWDKKDHSKIERLDSEKFYQDYVAKVFAGWKGLTQAVLARMLPVKVENPDAEVPFSVENAALLMRHAYDFETFVQGVVMDIERFREQETEIEIKNSESSQGG
jgi:hypothetical protein